MKRYLICNWKCHKSELGALDWLKAFKNGYRAREDVEIVICPPSICLPLLKDKIAEYQLEQVSLAAQDISPFPRGSYTGALSADMVKPYAKMAIVGHFERRKYFHETNHEATNKVAELGDMSMTPILCLDDSYIHSQLAAIADVDCSQLIAAYCPTYALNSKMAETPENVKKAVADIKTFLPFSSIIYGGAVTVQNAKTYWDIEGIDGLFVGAAGLDAEGFLEILAVCA